MAVNPRQELLVHGTSIRDGGGMGARSGSKRIRERGRGEMWRVEEDRRPKIRDANLEKYKVECQRSMFQFYRIQCQTNASNVGISPGGDLSVGEDVQETSKQLF